jgi:hypothetical protein
MLRSARCSVPGVSSFLAHTVALVEAKPAVPILTRMFGILSVWQGVRILGLRVRSPESGGLECLLRDGWFRQLDLSL